MTAMRNPVIQTSHCRSCGAQIIWLRTGSGKAQPFDAVSTADGNRVIEDGVAVPFAPLLHADRPRYTAHHATCPHGAQWRSK